MRNSPEEPRPISEHEKRFQVRARGVTWLGALAAWALVSSCAPVALPDGERRVALEGTTERVILPTHAELRERTSELSASLDELVADPASVDLTALRQSYLDVRAPLGEAQAFAFGPAADLESFSALDQAPVDAAKIDAELDSDVELTPRHLQALGANKRGLHAIEYLLFPADDTELEAALLADDVAGERRRQFASAAGQLVAAAAAELDDAWQPENGGYARRFSEPGAPDSVDATVQAGLDTLLNETVVLSEVLANVRLGKPLGTTTGGKVDPTAQESGRAQASLSDMLSNLRGMRNVYFGTRDETPVTSLATLVHAKSPSADAHARVALADAEAAVRDIPEPFDAALADDTKKVQAAYDAVKSLKRVLATEVLNTLGASLKFSDNDGD
jgi:predicted lipoprotein